MPIYYKIKASKSQFKNKMEKKDITKRRKTLSRLIATQVYYQANFMENKDLRKIADEILENYVLFEDDKPSSYVKKIDQELLNKLINAISDEVAEIDEKIAILQKKTAKNDEILQNILRFGALELKIYKDIDFKIILSEYTDIAALFFDKEKVAFVNSVLNNLAKI